MEKINAAFYGVGLNALVIQELKHDAPFTWHLHNLATISPIFRWQHLAELDERLESYLACFQGSEQERYLLIGKLNPDDWGVVFIMVLVALRTNNSDIFDHAIEILKNDQQAKKFSDALCRVNIEIARPYIKKLLIDKNPLSRIAAITATGFFGEAIEKNHLKAYCRILPLLLSPR